MRILLTTDPIGGVWTFTRELSVGSLRRGHSVALVSFGREPSEEQRAWCSLVGREYGSRFRFVSSAVPLEWMQGNQATYRQGEAVLSRVAAGFAPDIVHSNQFCFGRLPGAVPSVVTAHSDVMSWAAACRPLDTLAPEWLERYRSLVQGGLDGADVVVAPTVWMLEALGEHFEVLSRSRVIANGRTLPASTGQPGHDKHASKLMQTVSVGRLWDEAKNLALLARMTPPMPILVAGEREHEECKAPLSEGDATPPWTLLGSLTESELLKLFRESSIYLVASIYEPFGLAPLEAALCGCAIVANDLPSLREVWGEAALYFKTGEEAVRHLRELRASPAALARARQKAYRRALTLSALRMTEAYLALYAETIGPGADAPSLPTDASLAELVVDGG